MHRCSVRSIASHVLLALVLHASGARADRMFVSGWGGSAITEVDIATGATRLFATAPPLAEDGTCSPSQSHVYFAHGVGNAITRWSLAGGPGENVPTAGGIRLPEGPTFDHAGNLYWNTRGNGAVGAFALDDGDPSGTAYEVIPPFTDFGEGACIVLAGPHRGALLVVDAYGSVLISEPPGAPARTFIPRTAFPGVSQLVGIASDGSGDVFVVHYTAGSGIRRFDPEGRFVADLVPPGGPISSAMFLEFDSRGVLHVTELTGVIWSVQPDGTVSRLARVSGAIGIAICRDRFVPPGGSEPECVIAPIPAACPRQLAAPGLEVDGSGSRDPGGGRLTFSWTTDCPDGRFDDPNTDKPRLIVPDAPCDLACMVRLEVTAESGLSASCEAAVSVHDDAPPTFDAPGDQFSIGLWPPSHGYVAFEVAALGSASDGPCGRATVTATGCASSQPENARDTRRRPAGPPPPNGDGNTVEDCVISLDGTRFAVRAERLGSCGPDSARTYAIELTATDDCGNSATSQGYVIVSHDRSGHEDVVDARPLPPNAPPPFEHVHPTTYGRGCE